MVNYLESFFFIMMAISPALIGIPLQILATRKKQELSRSFLINCILASGVQFIFLISYVFYMANFSTHGGEAVGWLLVIYAWISIFLIGINSLLVLAAHFMTKWVLKRKV